jgi:hypothetical protein
LCTSIPENEFVYKKTANQSKEAFMTPFMLSDRGNCSFVNKVRHMEEAGAAVGIVVDNVNEDVSEIIMSDDGTGAGIRMPSMLIGKADGKKLTDFLTTADKKTLD